VRGALVALLLALLASPATAAEVDDPHGRSDRCAACHEEGDSEDRPGPPLPSVAACTACHPRRARDKHAVGMTPVRSSLPAGWPAEAGEVVCATCHAEPACDADRPDQRPYLRGGPYPRPADVCWTCHLPLEYRRVDPHHPASKRDPDDRSCAACHTRLPDEGALPVEAGLRANPQTLCAVCHAEAMHEGADLHVGRPLAEGVEPGLPLDAGGRVACWTCHEVHRDSPSGGDDPEGRAAALAIVEQVIGRQWLPLLPEAPDWPGRPGPDEHDPMLALTATDDALCRACHGAGPRDPGGE